MTSPPVGSPGPRARWQLALASAAVLLAAADTYVVVVALPSIMGGVGIGLDQLQRATPVISGFLLGYVAVLPLLGRLSDLAGRRPVLLACLGAFCIGSLVTATARDLPVLVAGRAVQGLGGGGLVPVTLSLVAATWAEDRRGVPLGVVGAVQELGSVLGPLWGALLVAVSSWRAIFWLNLPLAAAVGVAFTVASRARTAAKGGGADATGGAGRAAGATGRHRSASGRADIVGAALGVIGLGLFSVGLWAPPALADSVRWGAWVVPEVGGAAWTGLSDPAALTGLGLLGAFVVWELAAPSGVRRLADLRRTPAVLRGADLPGAALLAGVLACVVIAFSTADPSRQIVASSAPVLVPVAAVLAGCFTWRQRRAASPLIGRGALRARPAWGALLVNLALGAGLMAALVDVPLFARATRYPSSELGAALELVRFLVAVPVGALAGGLLLRRPRLGPAVAAGGAGLAGLAFVAMATWGVGALAGSASDVELVACGLGFGLAIAPVNAAVLASVAPGLHGLVTALAVVARTIGMLAGLSALTALGLRRFYEAQARIGSPLRLCPTHPQSCPAYDRASVGALLSELHTIFLGAAIACAVAALLAALLLRSPRPVTPPAAPVAAAFATG
jgi:MFS family permease